VPRGLQKKRKRKQAREKKSGEKRPTDFSSFFFLGAPFRRYARRLWTCHRRWAPAAGCGVFLCELVPSGDPFIYAVFAKLFFWRNLFSPTDFLFPPKNKLMSQRGLQLLPYKASPIRTSTCTTSPLSSPLFALCVRYVVFEEAEGAALRPPFGLTTAISTYWGVAGVVGVLVPPRWCQNDVQQVFTK
jgi:hypothetical protein